MSRALSSGQAKAYYQTEYTSTRESYYTEQDRVEGEWAGTLADEWGLEGGVDKEKFERLIDGQDPHTSDQLVKHVSCRKQTNQYGKEVSTSEHRAGWDATFSAPKSVSIAALIGKDERIREAHRESVDAALKELEKYTQARIGGSHPAQDTGKFIAAKFEHDSSRPDRATGYAAPQLHTHVVIFNMTRLEDGRFKPLQPLELYRSQQYATAIYRAHLAEKLRQLGYEIEVEGRTGAPEIKGFSREYIAANSTRRDEIKQEAQEMKERLEREGISVKEGAGLNQAAAKTDRASKLYDREEMLRRHQEMDAKYGYQAQRVAQESVERGSTMRSEEEVARRAQESVTFARDNAVEREAVADVRKVMVDALRRNMGLTTYEAVRAELKARQEYGEFIGIAREHQPKETTTQRMLAFERANIQTMIDGRGQSYPIVEGSQVQQTIETITAEQSVKLNGGQRAAIEQLLASHDRVVGLQGGAGTGKTTVLATLREAAENAGYEVQGFAPTTRAAKLLAESGIETSTLQRFLRQGVASDNEQKRLYVLDESSLASTKNLFQFFKRIGEADKVLLVGDARQHQAVEAGSPFEQFQKHGMETTRLTEIVRQKDPQLKEAIEKLAATEVKQAVEQLRAQGRVIEIADARERLAAIAASYVQQPANALVISPANKERVAINAMIHQELQGRGVVSRDDHRTTVYVNRQGMTGTERTFAGSYVPGEDIIRYNRASKVYGVKIGNYGRVTATDYEQNTITVKLETGREITYNPARLQGVSVYKKAERQFAEGDRLQFRAPLPEQMVSNGELGTLEKVEGEEFTVRLDSGREVSFNAREFRHLDHGYAVTSYSSQGQTVDRVIVNADTRESDSLLNRRMGYVALSRARNDAQVYTNSAEELGAALDRQVDKQMAVEAIRESQMSANNIAAAQRAQEREKPTKQGIKWLHVTAHDPCPVCHKPDNCAVSADGALAYCRRVESDRPGRDGGFLHILSDRPDYTPRLIIPEDVPQHDRAAIECRDAVYQDMLSILDLKERERKNLAERGLDAETIEENNYKSVPSRMMADAIAQTLEESGDDLRGVPGFYREKDADGEPRAWRLNVSAWHQGLLVSVRDAEERIEGFQIRRAEAGDDSPRYVWLSSSNKPEGASSGAPVHFRNVEQIRATGRAIITEGALKGDIIAHYTDRGVIAVQGVSSFQQDFGARLRATIPELRRVSIAFDADYAHNPNVQRALVRLTETLRQAGLETETLTWEESKGKGLDDYLKNKLGRNFWQVPQLERAERQQQILREIGWGEMSASGERFAHQSEAPQVNGQDNGDSWKRLRKAELQDIERRITLGDEEDPAMEVKHRVWLYEQAQEQSDGRRYKVVDQSTGLMREMSLREVEQRAVARSARLADEQSPTTASERMELRQKLYVREIGAHEQTLRALDAAHRTELSRLKSDLDRASAAHRRVSPQAQEIEMAYDAGRQEKPLPIISHERLDELHEQAVERRDVAQLERLEEIRQSLPIEFGGHLRDEHSVARLQGQRFAAETSREVSRKRLEDFERSHHLRRWEVNGEKWSRAELDRHIARQEKAAASYDKSAAAYKRHLVSAFVSDSPMRLLKSSGYNAKSETAAAEAARARAEIIRLQPIREEVIKLTETQRAELKYALEMDTRFASVLSRMETQEREMRAAQGRGMPAPALSEKELRRIESNAASLRDPELLRQHRELAKQDAPIEQGAMEKLAARSFAREAAAEVALRESEARLARFEERRDNMPLLYTSTDGQESTATLREVEPRSWSDRAGRYFTQTDEQRAEHAAVQRAAMELHARLIEDRNTAQDYYEATREIAESYRQQLATHNEELPAPHYTAKEIAAIEVYATKQTDDELQAEYEELVRAAISEGRVDYSVSYAAQHEQGHAQLSAGQEMADTTQTTIGVTSAGKSLDQSHEVSGRDIGTSLSL